LKMLNFSSAKFCDERHDFTIHCMDHVIVVPSCHARPLKLSRLPGQTLRRTWGMKLCCVSLQQMSGQTGQNNLT
jgi:hypothetical protein